MAYRDDESQKYAPPHQATVERCPCCGRRYSDAPICAPFVARTSQLLDMVTLARDVLRDMQAALEEEALS